MLKPTAQLHSSHMLVMPKILQARLQQYMNHELPDLQADFRKGRDQIVNIHWIMEKGREFQKNIYFCFIDYVATEQVPEVQDSVGGPIGMKTKVSTEHDWDGDGVKMAE